MARTDNAKEVIEFRKQVRVVMATCRAQDAINCQLLGIIERDRHTTEPVSILDSTHLTH